MTASEEPEVDPPPSASPPGPASEGAIQWLLALALGAGAVVSVAGGLRSAPTTATLLERATESSDARSQVRAMHALVLRGYWEERPLEELSAHLEASAPEVGDFVTRLHGSLLRPR